MGGLGFDKEEALKNKNKFTETNSLKKRNLETSVIVSVRKIYNWIAVSRSERVEGEQFRLSRELVSVFKVFYFEIIW